MQRKERPRVERPVRRYVIITLTLLPLIVAGVFVGATKLQGLYRYDPAYFGERYQARYQTPGETARQLEIALGTADQDMLAELQGLRRPASFHCAPSLMLIMLWNRNAGYSTYMYLDMQTLERYPHYIQRVRGRWVVSPADAYYFLHSGRWLAVLGPLALLWWLVEGVVALMVWVFRVAGRQRARMYGTP